MKALAFLGLAAACLTTSPALAGPAGAGLTFTEEVAKKNLQKRAAGLQASACGPSSPAPKTEPALPAKDRAGAPETCRAN